MNVTPPPPEDKLYQINPGPPTWLYILGLVMWSLFGVWFFYVFTTVA